MSNSGDRLIALGGRLLLDRSESLIALIDADGTLVEVSASMQRLIDQRPGVGSIFALLDPSSSARLAMQILQAIHGQITGQQTLNFSAGPLAISRSYRCSLAVVAESQLVLLAEPNAALDYRTAEEYIRVTSELAATNRSLQKLSYELAHKQRSIEEALARIEHLARIDDLTQIFNRRSILGALADEVERALRYPADIAVLLIDIDHFKQVNDRYGHPVGDEVLRSCAGLLRSSIRSTDHLGRYGGEEFLCVLPMTAAARAAELAERLRRDVEHASFSAAETVTFSLTISVGVAEFDLHEPSADMLIAHADIALYRAKARGRNCVEIWCP